MEAIDELIDSIRDDDIRPPDQEPKIQHISNSEELNELYVKLTAKTK